MIRALLALALALAACATDDGSPDPLPYPPCNELACDAITCDEHAPVCTCAFDDGTDPMTCHDTDRH